MRQKFEFQEELTKKWIKEAGTDDPGDAFHLSVLKKISEIPLGRQVYQPVISPLAWKFILGYIAGIAGISFLFFPSESSSPTWIDRVPPITLPTFRIEIFNFSQLIPEFSPQFIVGIAAFFSFGFILTLLTLKSKQQHI